MTLGGKIKMLRVRNRLTQKDLADQVHVTFQTVSKWENDENEPDVATLRELAKTFNCSIDYLTSPDEEEQQESVVTPVVAPNTTTQPVVEQKTVVVHQKEMHVCERCKKDIPDGELEMEQILVRPGGRGHRAVYRQGYYHKSCLETKHKEDAAKKLAARKARSSSAKKKCFGWSIASGILALVVALIVLIGTKLVSVGAAIGLCFLAGYGIFSMIYCILAGSYIGDVFVWCAKLSIRFPGIIFSWDFGGIIFLITMKVLFAVLGFLIGLFALGFAIALSSALGMVSFPFVLIHDIHTDYEDSFFD